MDVFFFGVIGQLCPNVWGLLVGSMVPLRGTAPLFGAVIEVARKTMPKSPFGKASR